MLPALVVGMLSFPSHAHADSGCHSKRCVERVARKQCFRGSVPDCIKRAALHWHQPLADAMRVARCESSLDPSNSYLGHYGVFQFLQSTFDSTRYRGRSIWSAKWNSLAAMWMWKNGRRSEWACQ